MVLSEKEAFKAMFLFLETHYDMTGADDIGALLSVLSLGENNMPIDKALWEDWLEAIEKIKNTSDEHFKLKIIKKL